MTDERHKHVQITKNTDPDTFEWRAEEYLFKEKTNDWYWSVGIISLAVTIASFYLKNFFFGVIALIGGFSLALFGSRRPNVITFKITDKGVVLEKNIFLFDDLEAFHMDTEIDGHPRLFLRAKRGFSSHIMIPIDEIDIHKISSILKKHLKEEHIEEPFYSILSRIIGL